MRLRFKERLNHKGYTLIELLVAMALASIVLLGVLRQYLVAVQEARDNQIRVATFLQAQGVVQNVGFELRILGNGVPFDQANFQIGEPTLSDPTVTQPIDVTTASATNIAFRSNETGDVFLLTQNFDPSVSSTINLTDVSSLDVNDPIYLSNSVVSSDDGLYGVITAVNAGAKTVTINGASMVTTLTGATFNKGSLLEEVPLVTYNYDSVLKRITRDSGFGPVVIAENASLSLDYLDFNGSSLALPISNVDVINSLRSISVTVSVDSNSVLSDGNTYTSTVTQIFGLRNLNYLF